MDCKNVTALLSSSFETFWKLSHKYRQATKYQDLEDIEPDLIDILEPLEEAIGISMDINVTVLTDSPDTDDMLDRIFEFTIKDVKTLIQIAQKLVGVHLTNRGDVVYIGQWNVDGAQLINENPEARYSIQYLHQGGALRKWDRGNAYVWVHGTLVDT